MEFGYGYRAKNEIKMNRLKDETIGLNSVTTLFIIKLPNSLVLRVMSRSLFLAMVFLALPSIGSLLRGPPSSLFDSESMGSDSVSFDLLPLLFRDLADEGLLKKGDKALIVSSGIENFMDYLELLNGNEIEFAIESDLESQSLIPEETFDFVFKLNSGANKFIDPVLKVGGIAVMQLSNDPSDDFRQQSNYKIVYLRRFSSTVVAIRKTALADDSEIFPAKLQLCGGGMVEAKKAALKGLEDALLEPPPPRRALAKPSDYLKKTKFLPDLLADSLESYRRRILITDYDNGGALDWFYQSYPTRNQYFEVYNLEIEIYDMEKVSRGMMKMIGISDWLMKNVREEDFVVMKAEVQVVEEMMRERTICMVDELFLECNSQRQGGGREENEGKRAYWECLALYGRLRDEGVAVHQWWG